MCQTMAPVVLPAGISERNTNQPFCARSRPSKSMKLAVSETTFTRASGVVNTEGDALALGERQRLGVALGFIPVLEVVGFFRFVSQR